MNHRREDGRSGLGGGARILAVMLVLSMAFSYLVVQAPSASAEPGGDYIQIRTAPGGGGDVVRDRDYFVGDVDHFWAAMYNFSSGYVKDVQVYWFSTKSTVGTVDPSGNNTTFRAVGEGVTQVNAYCYDPSGGTNYRLTNITGNLTVRNRGIDYVQIRDGPNGGGNIVTMRSYFVGDKDKFYAAGYNLSRGFVSDLPATWSSSNTTVCTITRGGLEANLQALNPGVCVVSMIYDLPLGNTTGDLIVKTAPGIPRPAPMMKAELTGPAYNDITLTWSSSPDDGGGSDEVTNYRVMRSEGIGGPFSVVATVSASGSPKYSWTDPGAGHGDPHDYFYHVIASSPFRDSAPTKLAGKYSRTMSAGKQLVSVPLEQADYGVPIVFQTFGFTYVRTYIAGTPNPWWCHKPGRFINTLTELSILDGYWVDLDSPGTMTVAGLVPDNMTINLLSGWNMIGFPSFRESYTFADLDAAIGGSLQLVEIYDPSAGPYYLQKVLRNAWSTTYLQSGFAYMVRVSVDSMWLVPNA